MPMSKDLARMAKDCGVPTLVTAWLEKEELFEVSDVGLLCAEEKLVEAKFLNLVPDLTRLKYRTAATKLWIQCRAAVDRDASKRNGSVTNVEDPVPEPELKETKQAWYKRHHYHLPQNRLLARSLYDRRYNELNASPRELSVILPEALRTRASVDRRSAHGITVVPNQPAMGTEIAVDTIPNYYELWRRIRADFSTMAHVCISDISFFAFADCERLCDDLLEAMHTTYDQKLAPVSHFIKAHISMMRVFSESVTTDHMKLKDVVQNKPAYMHFWTGYVPGPQAHQGNQPAHPNGGQGASLGPDLPADLQKAKNDAEILRRKHDANMQVLLGGFR